MSKEALSFLQLLGTDFWLQTFDDKKRKERTGLVQDFWVNTLVPEYDNGYSTLPLSLIDINKGGGGIYFCVNGLRSWHGRRVADNVECIRAFFVDLDGAPLEPVMNGPLQPNIIVRSSADRWHAYWIMKDYVQADRKLFKQLQTNIAVKFNGDKSVTDLCRVMRLPGFYNMKKEPYMVTYEVLRTEGYSLQEVQDEYYSSGNSELPDREIRKHSRGSLLGQMAPQSASKGEGRILPRPEWAVACALEEDAGKGNIAAAAEDFEFDAARLRGAMLALNVDDYAVWIQCMLALKGSTVRSDAELSDAEAYEYWLSWSGTGAKFDERMCELKWQDADVRGDVGLGTIFMMATDAGWNKRGALSWTYDEWLEKERKRLGIRK